MKNKILFLYYCYCCFFAVMVINAQTTQNRYFSTITSKTYDNELFVFSKGKINGLYVDKIGHQGARVMIYDNNGKLLYPYIFTIKEVFTPDLLFICAEEEDCTKESSRCGLMNRNGKLVLPLEYKSYDHIFPSKISPLGYLTRTDGKTFVVDKYGKVIGPITMEGINYNADDGKKYHVDRYGTTTCLTPSKYGTSINFFRENNKIGLRDTLSKKILISAEYDELIKSFNTNQDETSLVFIAQKNGKFGLFDITGKALLPTIYESIERPYGNDFIIKMNGNFGLYQLHKKIVINPTLHVLYPVDSDGKAYYYTYDAENRKKTIYTADGKIFIRDFVCHSFYFWQNVIVFYDDNGRYGIADKKGNIITEPKYYSIRRLGCKHPTLLNANNGWINSDGKEIVNSDQFIFTTDFYYDHKAFFVNSDSTCGWIDTTGKIQNIVVPRDGHYKIMLDDIYDEHDGQVTTDFGIPKIGIIDKSGKVIVPAIYDQIYGFVEGLAPVIKNGKMGYINTKGEEIVPPIYDNVYEKIGSVSKVVVLPKDGKYFLISLITGKVLGKVPTLYRLKSKNNGFHLALQSVKKPNYSMNVNVWGLINDKAEIVVPVEYDNVSLPSDDMIPVCKDKLWGYYNTQGKMVIPLQYSDAHDFCDGKAMVGVGNGVFFIDKTGKCIEQCENQK